MNFRKTLLLSLVLGVLSANPAFSHPPGGPIGGGPMGGQGGGRYPINPADAYPVVVPYGYPSGTSTSTYSGPPIQGGASVTNGNQTINANGTTCVVSADGKKTCN